MLSREWRCSWSSADRRCSNYIWVIDNFIAYLGASYIRGFTVVLYNGWWHIRKDFIAPTFKDCVGTKLILIKIHAPVRPKWLFGWFCLYSVYIHFLGPQKPLSLISTLLQWLCVSQQTIFGVHDDLTYVRRMYLKMASAEWRNIVQTTVC